ncbi:MAG: hypothetical protein ACOYUZ_01825 [Patescibacteria group bacterium]
MKFEYIYIGTWTPSSTIHLKEFYRALSFWDSASFKKSEIKKWTKGLELEEIHYRPASINFIEGRFVNRVFFRVSEDGLIMAGRVLEDLEKDSQRLEQFLTDKIVNLWDNLFSRGGASMPKVFEEIRSVNPALVKVSGASVDEMDKVFRTMNVIPYKKVALADGEVWIGESLVVVNNTQYAQETIENMVEHLLFAREYELQLERLITAYHVLWNKVEGIRTQKAIQQSELAKIHDQIINIQSQANFFRGRLNQMKHFLEWRNDLVDEYVTDPDLNKTFKKFFASLFSSQKYLQELWAMLHNYINSTLSLISFLYSDSERKNLGTLQKLFLVQTVSSIIALGGLSTVYLNSVLIFGAMAITAAVFIYYLLFVVFSRRKKVFIFRKDIELEEKK